MLVTQITDTYCKSSKHKGPPFEECLLNSHFSLAQINGQLTAGEALADVAGLVAAYQVSGWSAGSIEAGGRIESVPSLCGMSKATTKP